MKNEGLITLVGSAGIVLFAGAALVLAPYLQLGATAPSPGLQRPTAAQKAGRDIYVSEGCVFCHSQQPRDPVQSVADQERGWGRPSVPGDYVYDYPHQLGTMRTGPDLLNVGARLPTRAWHHVHLYQPRAVSPGSIMPSYRYLYEVKEAAGPDDVVVNVPDEWKVEPGVVVATERAKLLVNYLISLDHTDPIVVQRDEEVTE